MVCRNWDHLLDSCGRELLLRWCFFFVCFYGECRLRLFGSLVAQLAFCFTQESEDCPTVPDNDNCTAAEVVSELPYVVEANNEMASPQGSVPDYDCYNVYEDTKTVWWEIETQENSTCLQVKVEFGSYPWGDIAVYSGDSCDFLSCLVYGSGSELVGWKAEPLTRYFVVVAQYGGSGGGNFELSITVSQPSQSRSQSFLTTQQGVRQLSGQ